MKSLLTIALLTVITACSSTTKHVVVSPEVLGYSKGIYFDHKITFNTIDQRKNRHIVQIIKDNQPAELLSSKEQLTNIITGKLSPILRKQGLTIDTFSAVSLTIIIDTALIEVQQSLFKYTAKNTISIRAKVKNGDTLLTKNFNISGTSHGPLKADIAVLERDFNNQLASILLKAVNNKEIQTAIKTNVNNF